MSIFDTRNVMAHYLRVAPDSTDPTRWAEDLVRRVGAAVKRARGPRSAKWLSDRTEELGYRISPAVIAKLDSGHRGEVLSVAELLILAAALDIPPVLLLFPGYPEGNVDLLPGYRAWVPKAVEWMAGSAPMPVQILDDETFGDIPGSNDGVELVRTYARLRHVEAMILDTRFLETREATATPERQRGVRQQLQELESQRAGIEREIAIIRTRMWGADA